MHRTLLSQDHADAGDDLNKLATCSRPHKAEAEATHVSSFHVAGAMHH